MTIAMYNSPCYLETDIMVIADAHLTGSDIQIRERLSKFSNLQLKYLYIVVIDARSYLYNVG